MLRRQIFRLFTAALASPFLPIPTKLRRRIHFTYSLDLNNLPEPTPGMMASIQAEIDKQIIKNIMQRAGRAMKYEPSMTVFVKKKDNG